MGMLLQIIVKQEGILNTEFHLILSLLYVTFAKISKNVIRVTESYV